MKKVARVKISFLEYFCKIMRLEQAGGDALLTANTVMHYLGQNEGNELKKSNYFSLRVR